jgi:hypothetical protein
LDLLVRGADPEPSRAKMSRIRNTANKMYFVYLSSIADMFVRMPFLKCSLLFSFIFLGERLREVLRGRWESAEEVCQRLPGEAVPLEECAQVGREVRGRSHYSRRRAQPRRRGLPGEGVFSFL